MWSDGVFNLDRDERVCNKRGVYKRREKNSTGHLCFIILGVFNTLLYSTSVSPADECILVWSYGVFNTNVSALKVGFTKERIKIDRSLVFYHPECF